jgi:phage terminase large subunit GpA-like protein
MKRAKRKPVTLSQWIETNIVLPDVVAVPGPLVLAPYMREIADAIGDPAVERVSVLKSARIGFSTVLTAAIAYHVVKGPVYLGISPSKFDEMVKDGRAPRP